VITGLAKETLSMFFLIGVMIYQSWELALMALVGFPLAIFPIARLGRRMRKLSDGTQHELGELTAQLDESFQGVRIVKAYGTEAFEEERARSRVESLFRLYFKAARIQAAASPMMEMIGGIAIAVVVWYGGWQVIDGRTTPGAFFSFIAAMLMAYKPVKSMASLNTHLQEGLAAAKRFFAMLDEKPRVKDAADAKTFTLTQGRVELEHVGFRYGEDGGGVSDVTLVLEPGQTVALVGASGSGKSTLINLILRFYDVSDGAIKIDGQDIRDVTQHSLRSQMALVSQDVVLFDDTVAANIAYGRPELTREAVMEAAKKADAHAFISDLPQGYDTMIGPHGVRLSGGQRQRLSIARAILRDAPLLLLDEATSALDTQSERSVQEALNHLMEGRTTLVIAHRLSTIVHADMIYVMDKGRVVEQGNHDELLRWEGAYARLYQMQFAGN
jgi:subfamily B ATP-binding cassette protein MsbA